MVLWLCSHCAVFPSLLLNPEAIILCCFSFPVKQHGSKCTHISQQFGRNMKDKEEPEEQLKSISNSQEATEAGSLLMG